MEAEPMGTADNTDLTTLSVLCQSLDHALQEIATLEAQLRQARELVERAFRDGVAYATICEVVDVDLAWETSAVRTTLTAIEAKK
jgi:hypothetical protein